MSDSIDMNEYFKSNEKKLNAEELSKKSKTNQTVASIEMINLNVDDSLASGLLMIISKLSNTHPELALKLLALCANDDISKASILKYTIQEIEEIRSDKK